MLRAIGHRAIERFHMNEGHASLLAMELLDEQAADAGRERFNHDDVEAVRRKCVFTTHTPVPAGHDKFPMEMVTTALGRNEVSEMREVFCCGGELNMTYLALNLSHYINGVAKKHTEISQRMFAGYKIEDITNGVHVPTWTSPPFQRLYRPPHPRLAGRQLQPALRPEPVGGGSVGRPRAGEGRAARPGEPRVRSGNGRQRAHFRVRPAHRRLQAGEPAVPRPRAAQVAGADGGWHPAGHRRQGPSGRPRRDGNHPVDFPMRSRHSKGRSAIAYLTNYDWQLGQLMTAGVDVWLNTPLPPKEASGTSGMKAAMNGVPSLSILDGWWIEGCIEGVTGWSIGGGSRLQDSAQTTALDAASLYEKMERVVIPLYYHDHARFLEIMRHAIALNGAFFNSQRMLLQYVLEAYF